MRTERNWGSRTGAKRPFWKKGAIIHHLKVVHCVLPKAPCRELMISAVCSNHTGEATLIGVKAGTILIDERLCEPQRLGRLRFTCGHELAHWVLHKKLYTGTGDVAAYDGNSSTDESNGIIERQADAMATALLMPLPQVKKCFYRLRSGRSTEQLIYEMSQIFAVSKQAMQIRLQSHNLI